MRLWKVNVTGRCEKDPNADNNPGYGNRNRRRILSFILSFLHLCFLFIFQTKIYQKMTSQTGGKTQLKNGRLTLIKVAGNSPGLDEATL